MNASFAKNQMAHLAPAGHAYQSTVDAAARAQTEGHREVARGVVRKVADALAYLVAMPKRRAVLDELSQLSDRELADIGVARSELKRVFDPAFTRERAMRGASYRSLGLNV